jgi:surface protein
MGNIFMKIIKFISFAAKPIAKLTEAIAKKEYAVVSPDGTTLTFYFDKHKSSRQGTAYRLNVVIPKWVKKEKGSLPYNPNFTTVVFDESFKDARPVSCAYWFGGFENLTKIEGIDNLNTSRVRNMLGMFCNCKRLFSLDLSKLDT